MTEIHSDGTGIDGLPYKHHMCLVFLSMLVVSPFNLRRIADASLALSAEANFLAFSKTTVEPQYGQVLVFWSLLARKSLPHLLHSTTNVDVKFSLSESLFHAPTK
jgi:hypothetical protein